MQEIMLLGLMKNTYYWGTSPCTIFIGHAWDDLCTANETTQVNV